MKGQPKLSNGMTALKGSFIERDNVRLHVVDRGEGKTVLLLHGFPDSVELWRYQIPFLVSNGYRVVAVDLRGFGESDAPRGKDAYLLPETLADIIAILLELNIHSRVAVVGHDWGAVVGWHLAAYYPEKVSQLVALSVGHPSAYVSDGVKQKLKAWYILLFLARGVAERLLPAGNWLLLRLLTASHPEVTRWIADLERPGRLTAGLNWYRANVSLMLKERLPSVVVPVTGVWSSGDVALTESQMMRSELFLEAKWHYHRISGATHWLPIDAPDELNRLLLESLREL